MIKYINFTIFLLCLFLASLSYAQIQNEEIMQEGDGYSLKKIDYIDESGISRSTELYFIHNLDGAINAHMEADLPVEELLEIQNEVAASPIGFSASGNQSNAVREAQFGWIIDKNIANLQSDAEAQAYVDSMDLQHIVDQEAQDPEGDANVFSGVSTDGRFFKRLFRCKGWRSKTKGFSKGFDQNISGSKTFGNGSASLTFSGQSDIDADISVDLGYDYKRNFFCLPYKVRYRDLRTKGKYDIDGNFKIKGKATKNFGDYSWRVANPKILDTVFFVGPVPVRLAMKLPIHIGTGDIILSASGEVGLTKNMQFNGKFHYYCNKWSCSRVSSSHTNTVNELKNNIGASISASLTLKPYLHVAARPYLYFEGFLYAQVGVKPSFPIEAFGYYGNLCGDGDNDGVNETVSAGLGTLDFELGITGEAKLLGTYLLKPKYWKVLNKPLFMVDFINPSSAFSPNIRPLVQNTYNVSLPVSVRSCVDRFTNRFPETYSINWGDGRSSTLHNVRSSRDASHTYQQSGLYIIEVSSKKGAKTSYPVLIADTGSPIGF